MCNRVRQSDGLLRLVAYNMPMSYLHRSIIDTIPGYKQGKPAPCVAGLQSYKISSNENPYPPLPSVLEAITTQAVPMINRYPNMRGTQVVHALANEYDVDDDCVVLGCGSTEVITQLVGLVAGPGDEVIYPWRSFEAYPIIVASAGAQSVKIANRADGSHDVDAIIEALNPRTRLVILNNPNNPTATSLSEADIRRVLEAVPSDVLVLLDEAYVQFNTDDHTVDGMRLFKAYPNVVVARTFSKAYGLAGLRIGYAVAPREVAQGMLKVALPFGVSQIAQVAALASLKPAALGQLHERVQALILERDRMMQELRVQGWHIAQPYANFFWVPLGEHTDEANDMFRESGLSVRAFSGEGIRITIGEREANDRVLNVMQRIAQSIVQV